VNVEAALTLHNIDDLQLSEHLVELQLQLGGLPVSKLLVGPLNVEDDYLVALDDL